MKVQYSSFSCLCLSLVSALQYYVTVYLCYCYWVGQYFLQLRYKNAVETHLGNVQDYVVKWDLFLYFTSQYIKY
jgi:hypothetical protein